jgi:hypothetical protein
MTRDAPGAEILSAADLERLLRSDDSGEGAGIERDGDLEASG